MIPNISNHPSNPYPTLSYIPPNPKYFDYENRYGRLKKNKMYVTEPKLSANDYATGIEQFLEQKQDLNRYKIQLLYTEIGVRSYINGQLLYRINQDQCTCQNLIMARGDRFLDRQRIELENRILDLEAEKRREEAAFFRDLSFLNRELRQARIETLDEYHKQAMCLNMEAII